MNSQVGQHSNRCRSSSVLVQGRSDFQCGIYIFKVEAYLMERDICSYSQVSVKFIFGNQYCFLEAKTRLCVPQRTCFAHAHYSCATLEKACLDTQYLFSEQSRLPMSNPLKDAARPSFQISLNMTRAVQELETCVRLQLNIVVAVLNDSGFGMIKWKQKAEGLPK
jgi:hypothetical protein